MMIAGIPLWIWGAFLAFVLGMLPSTSASSTGRPTR